MVDENKNWDSKQIQSISDVFHNTRESHERKIGRLVAQSLSFMADLLENFGEKRSEVAKKVKQRSGL